MRAAWKPGVAAASRIDTLQQTCCWPVTLVDLLGLQINTAFFPLFFVLLNNVKLISMFGSVDKDVILVTLAGSNGFKCVGHCSESLMIMNGLKLGMAAQLYAK